ncbi:plastocyanin/azurin family copper-binding protein [Oceanicella actignis]|uniref:Plastocyanin n=1 Tax=Oceanicella actignis TaxID=1189325 RepID=A0A1M7U5I3_9RHOB|nr:plastocyanin/azurin family copper-binding protein [Oceanicella actignis]SET89777.1 Plastocyanin [Oceanicella actignis]SHN78174.1 Plastocyanin [Oceanicella actignis]
MTTTRRALLTVLAAVPFGAIASRARACSGVVHASVTVHEVDIKTFQFQPSPLTIAPGDAVRWTNRDGIEHSATAVATGADGKPRFDTGLFGKGESREVTFTEPGSHDYFCTRHPSMKGRIVVAG